MKTRDSKQPILENGIRKPSERGARPRKPLVAVPLPEPLSAKKRKSPPIAHEVANPKRQITKNIPSRSALPLPIPVYETQLKALQGNSGLLTRALNWIRNLQPGLAGNRRLQVVTTALLGEKRFVAVIRVDGLEFLIGGGATSVALLAQLDEKESFKDLLRKTVATQKRPIANSRIEQASGQA